MLTWNFSKTFINSKDLGLDSEPDQDRLVPVLPVGILKKYKNSCIFMF